MLKKIRNRFGILLIMFLIVSMPMYLTVGAASDDQSFQDYIIQEFGFEFAANYFNSLNVLEAFYSILPKDGTGNVIYPDYFGGIYINSNGEIVLLVVEL